MNKEMISLSGVGKVFRTSEIETVALENVNLSIARGEFVAVMGPSGCGKSTLLNLMGLLDRPTTGSVTIDGVSGSGLKDSQMAAFRNRTIGFVFQSFHLIPSLSVADNVAVPLVYAGRSVKERRERVREVLEQVGMSHRMNHLPGQLSGGQCQRVAIARAIACNPEVILADEPTGNLDSRMSDEILQLLLDLNERQGRTIVMVTHNEQQAHRAHRIVRFFDGRQVE